MAKMQRNLEYIDDKQREKNLRIANRTNPLKKKVSLFVYVVVLILAVGSRTLQLMTNYDFSRDRYINNAVYTNYPLFIIIIGAVLLAFVLLTGSAKDKVIKSCVLINPWRLRYDRLNKKVPGSAGYSAVLMGALIIAQIAFDFFQLISANTEYMKQLTPDEAEDYSKLTGYTGGMGFTHFIMLLAALTFFSIAANVFKGEGLSHANCAALSTYGIFQVLQLFGMMSENAVISNSSTLIYEMASRMLAVLFFLSVARFFNGMEKKHTRFWMCFFGYLSSIVAATSVIPRYILLLNPNGFDDRLGMKVPEISDIGIVFMTITIVVVFWSTYVYRVMPRLNTGNRRWAKAPISRKWQPMEDIDQK